MSTITNTGSLIGHESKLVNVECETSNGLPTILMVGLAGKSIDEAKERVRSAVINSGLQVPKKKITLNLAPADMPKQGSSYDLPLAIAILSKSKQVPEDLSNYFFIGELSLSGELRSVPGALAHAKLAQNNGYKTIVLPDQNASEASLINGIEVLPADSLKSVVRHLNKESSLRSNIPLKNRHMVTTTNKIDFSDIRGQEQAKRAMQIVAAGGHNILLSGPPGAGKSMLAKALPSILPSMTNEEMIEVTNLHSIVGLDSGRIITERPVRSPHHTASYVSVIGGGRNPQPGEVSLSHRGILFLDELPEYSRQVLETLRQPLEDSHVDISRAEGRVRFPARFTLVATQNPCPCGYYGDQDKECVCTPHQVNQYSKRVSGPLLDRIDLNVSVQRIDNSKILDHKSDNGSDNSINHLLDGVRTARKMQSERFGTDTELNAHMSNRQVIKLARFSAEAKKLLDVASTNLKLSARAYVKITKVSRTIADLDQSDDIQKTHIAEALQYRFKT